MTFFLLKIVYGIYFGGIVFYLLNLVSTLFFGKQKITKRILRLLKGVGISVIWPILIFSPYGRKKLSLIFNKL